MNKDLDLKKEMVAAYGRDPFEDGDIIRFDKQFDQGGTIYTYAATKIGKYFYVTGNSGRMLWHQVLWFALEDNLLDVEIYCATEWS